MNIISYVKKNYKKLPKSLFDGKEVVVIKEKENEDHGYGHHSYEGVGIDSEGQTFWLYSSGCSCNGTVTIDHRDVKSPKALLVELDLSDVDPTKIDFNHMQVTFESY